MMTPYCAKCAANGWCEYDPATDTIYPSDEGACPERTDPQMMEFDLAAFAKEVHENAVAHGWWDEERSAAEVRALIHSEWSEALEEARAGRPMVWHECMDAAAEPDERPVICDRCTDCICKKNEPAHDCADYNPKPEGVAVELMDGVIRILDWLEHEGYEVPGLGETTSRGCAAYRLDFPAQKNIRRLKPAEVVDALHYYTAINRCVKGNAALIVAAGIAMQWLFEKGVNPAKILLRKHRYNVTRPYKHGKKF